MTRTAPLTGTAHPPAWDNAWHTALDAMELDVAETEAVLARLHAEADHVPSPLAPWQPPAGLGPLPSTLADRARALLERQQRAAAELTRAMVGNRRQQRAAAAADHRAAARPVYIDTAV